MSSPSTLHVVDVGALQMPVSSLRCTETTIFVYAVPPNVMLLGVTVRSSTCGGVVSVAACAGRTGASIAARTIELASATRSRVLIDAALLWLQRQPWTV